MLNEEYDLDSDERRFYSICLENQSKLEDKKHFKMWKKLYDETGFDGKKISRIKVRLMEYGLIDDNYFVIKNKDNIKKIINVIETDRKFAQNFLTFIGVLLIITLVSSSVFYLAYSAVHLPYESIKSMNLRDFLIAFSFIPNINETNSTVNNMTSINISNRTK